MSRGRRNAHANRDQAAQRKDRWEGSGILNGTVERAKTNSGSAGRPHFAHKSRRMNGLSLRACDHLHKSASRLDAGPDGKGRDCRALSPGLEWGYYPNGEIEFSAG